MIARKSLNYERILNVEIAKTNDLISKLVPFHMSAIIKNEKKQVDEFNNLTLLYTDMVNFTQFSKSASDPKLVVNFLQKLFSRFDQLCEENKVYKVHTIGDSYVVMGYNGRLDKNRRVRGVVVDETNRVILTGLEMQEILNEIRESSVNPIFKNLKMRVGIHTGKVIAGIIGSKVVRYDLFGQGVLIANKIKEQGIADKVVISQDTYKILQQQEDILNEFNITAHTQAKIENLSTVAQSYLIERKENSSIHSSMISDFSNDEKGSKGSKKSKENKAQNMIQEMSSDAEEENDGMETRRKLLNKIDFD
jgi:class 3 adenylate cyclase